MSSGGGGKGGGKKTTTETTVPEWVRAPADRNLQRAEALQQIEYMPYYGAQVAAFNDNQAAAFQNNNNAAAAFGLLAPTDAMSSMPTPTTYANGMKGYSSIPLYDQAMAELTASNPDNMDAYSKLFGNAVPSNTPLYAGRSRGCSYDSICIFYTSDAAEGLSSQPFDCSPSHNKAKNANVNETTENRLVLAQRVI